VKNLFDKAIVTDLEKDIYLERSTGGCLVVSCPLLGNLLKAIRFVKKRHFYETL
jgi:hypothetical protein